jgi:hypothetical protein
MEEEIKDRENSVWLSPDTFHIHARRAVTSLSSYDDSSALTSSAKNFLESVIDKFVVVICASVRVQYQGRASSVANFSPRIVITKPDGTLIIHENTKQRPLNWQPPGTKFYLSIGHDSLILEAFRRKDRETVTLWFDKLYYIAASRISKGSFRFTGSESEMVDLIFQNPGLIEPGFTPERREFRTLHGTVDLLGKDREGNILILEFKRRQAQLSSASQLDRYVEYFIEIERRNEKSGAEGRRRRRRRQDARRVRKTKGVTRKVKVRGGIVAPTITVEALALLRKMGYEFFKLEPRIEMYDDRSE